MQQMEIMFSDFDIHFAVMCESRKEANKRVPLVNQFDV